MADRLARRHPVLEGLAFPARPPLASVAGTGPAVRFIYRGAPDLLAGAFGVELPTAPLRAHVEGDRTALWLGPDEWLLLAPDGDGAAIAATLLDALGGRPASLVDISHRQVGFAVSGARAEALLNAGCALDLDRSAFPVGMCTRTLLAKAELVLWRSSDEAFRIDVARSLAPYVVAFLDEAMHGIA